MTDKVLVTIEMRFTSDEDPDALGERIREATSQIVGRQALEDFRVRVLPLAPPKGPRLMRRSDATGVTGFTARHDPIT